MTTLFGQHQFGNSRISGDFGFSGMYYMPDSLIGAEKVDSKVRANAFINLLYSNGGFSAGVRYEYYQFPLIDFEKIQYQGQGVRYFFADYKNKFIQVTAGNFYEQFGNGLALRAYEDRQLGIDNSLLGARVKVTPYKGITIKGVWGIERSILKAIWDGATSCGALTAKSLWASLSPRCRRRVSPRTSGPPS